jgi:hypothetical protein
MVLQQMAGYIHVAPLHPSFVLHQPRHSLPCVMRIAGYIYTTPSHQAHPPKGAAHDICGQGSICKLLAVLAMHCQALQEDTRTTSVHQQPRACRRVRVLVLVCV